MHLFEAEGSFYLFDPFSVRLARLTKREYAGWGLLNAAFRQEPRTDRFTSASRPKKMSAIRRLLSQKGIAPPRRSAARIQPPSEEVEILVNAAQGCNLGCQYCFVGQGRSHYKQPDRQRLDPRLAKRLIEVLPQALPKIKTFCIHFYGGEPLLNLAAMRAAVEAAENSVPRFRFAVTTNGTLFSPQVFALFQRGGFSVILSIDGPPSIHDAVRKTLGGRPTHALVLKFLKRLRQERLFVRGSSVVRRNWPLRKALAYLHSLPVDLIKAQAVRLPPSHPIALSDSERAEYFQDLKELARSVIRCVQKGIPPKDDRFNSRVLQILTRTRRTSFCGAGRSVFGLAADGTVLPCVLLAGLDGTDLGRIDASTEWVERGQVWTEAHGPRTECRACWARPLCGGGCPAMLSVCGEDECQMVRANCEAALEIYAAFMNRPSDLLILAEGV